MSSTIVNGRYADAEVIVTFGDGWSYSKTKMEEFRSSGGFEKLKEAQGSKDKTADTFVAKKEDVKTLMTEMEIPKSTAEKALAAAKGDLKGAFEWLIYGPGSEAQK